MSLMERDTQKRLDVPVEHLVLMYQDGCSTKQISDCTGIPQRSVYNKLERAGVKFRPVGCATRASLDW